MLQTSTLTFLKNLKKHNTKEWFDKNRTVYETAKADFTDFTNKVIHEFGKKDPAIAGNPYPRQRSRKAPGTVALHHLDLDAALSGFAALIHGLENDDMSTLFKLYWILLEGPAGG